MIYYIKNQGARLQSNHDFKYICVEIFRGNKIIVERQIVKMRGNYIRSLLFIQWTRKPEVEPE